MLDDATNQGPTMPAYLSIGARPAFSLLSLLSVLSAVTAYKARIYSGRRRRVVPCMGVGRDRNPGASISSEGAARVDASRTFTRSISTAQHLELVDSST
ncbi:hypothetical protein K438DRAFT_1818928 [Mycena galopus ATCC 62051]|nr:hypothetical protein K438DRAFT_1818928 [Mycena galopus ATCC 62051]